MDFREWYVQDGCHYIASEASLKSAWFAAKESARREIDKLRAENESLQAKIDALMLEFCPDEMTDDQLKNWEEALKNE